MPSHGHEPDDIRGHEHAHGTDGPGAMHALGESRFAHEERHAIGLATLYALGHASVVLVLGIAALTAALAVAMFRFLENSARRTGMLGRF